MPATYASNVDRAPDRRQPPGVSIFDHSPRDRCSAAQRAWPAPDDEPRGRSYIAGVTDPDPPTQPILQARWLHLTRIVLPGLAASRGWPVRADHCFQRILLDAACGGCWYDHIGGRPAYAHVDPALLARAVALAEEAAAGTADLTALNRRSLGWRRARRDQSTKSCEATLQPAGALPL